MKSINSVIRSGRVMRMAAVLLLAGLAAACAGPMYDRGRGRLLSSSEIRSQARTAIVDYVINRYGRGSRPRTKSVHIQGYTYDEARVIGRVAYYSTPPAFLRVEPRFRCVVNRRNGRVRGIDLY